MPNHARWYDNPATGLPTIRRAPEAREAATPEQVRAWMQDGALAPAIEPEDNEDCDHCPTCGQSTDEEEDPE